LTKARAERLARLKSTLGIHAGADLGGLASADALRGLDHEATQVLLCLCAFYLARCTPTESGDPVARFHLDNGARLERLNALGDLSAKAARQSFGLMVNYLYDLDRVEAHHETFVHGGVPHSRALAALL
jgi:malonyl-CoA decarboxylase